MWQHCHSHETPRYRSVTNQVLGFSATMAIRIKFVPWLRTPHKLLPFVWSLYLNLQEDKITEQEIALA
jgi:hypothetical protein